MVRSVVGCGFISNNGYAGTQFFNRNSQCLLCFRIQKENSDFNQRVVIINAAVMEYKYSKTSLNRPSMGPTLNGPFRKLIA